jgi:hypothetical protein
MGESEQNMPDFTLKKYQELCQALLDSGYLPITVHAALSETGSLPGRVVILRHDVDREPEKALRLGELEEDMGIRSTYYFRYPSTFDPGIIRNLKTMDHEIGYHYEVLAKAHGDYSHAIRLFAQELSEFRKIVDVTTICMHGSPLSPYDNRDLWKVYDFRKCGILGEAYLSVEGFNYYSDTGRTWGPRNKVKDQNSAAPGELPPDSTDDMMVIINGKNHNRLYLTIHPERWSGYRIELAYSWARDTVHNIGKRGFQVIHQ